MKKAAKIRRYLTKNRGASPKEVAALFDAAISQVYAIRKQLGTLDEVVVPAKTAKKIVEQANKPRRGRPNKLAVKLENMRMQLAQTSYTSIADAQPDMVNHPPHYKDGGIEVIDFIEAKRLGYHLGNVIKYICRAGKKGTNMGLQDLQKARWYLDRAIAKNEVNPSTR